MKRAHRRAGLVAGGGLLAALVLGVAVGGHGFSDDDGAPPAALARIAAKNDAAATSAAARMKVKSEVATAAADARIRGAEAAAEAEPAPEAMAGAAAAK